jgi:uncharacterized protein (TIGR04141 family)
MVYYGGKNQKLEFCDFIDVEKRTLFFAKIVSKSAGMSHLVEQVRRTAQLLFQTDDEYRKRVLSLFNKYHQGADSSWLKSRPRYGDWNLCMVSLGKTANDLPFFATMGVAKVYKELRDQGHGVSFTKV